MNYVQGFVTPVPTSNKEKYREQAAKDIKESGVTLRPCAKPIANPFSRPVRK